MKPLRSVVWRRIRNRIGVWLSRFVASVRRASVRITAKLCVVRSYIADMTDHRTIGKTVKRDSSMSLVVTPVSSYEHDLTEDESSGSDSSVSSIENNRYICSRRFVTRSKSNRERSRCCICFGNINAQVPSSLLPCPHNSVVHNSCAWEWVCCHDSTDPDRGFYHISCPMCRSTKTTQVVRYRNNAYSEPVRYRPPLR